MKKTCTKCNIRKGKNDFGLIWNTVRNKFYERRICKECLNKAAREWRKINPEKSSQSSCNWVKRHPGKIIEYNQKYYRENPEKVLRHVKEYYENNKEKVLAYHQEYREKNHEEVLEKIREWRRLNPNALKEWKRKNYDRVIWHNQLRRSRLNRNISITMKDQMEILKRAKEYGRCPLCEKKPKKWSLEHATPLSKGGTHSKENLYYCCLKCNIKKNAKTLMEYWGKGIEAIPYLA